MISTEILADLKDSKFKILKWVDFITVVENFAQAGCVLQSNVTS